MSHDALEGAFVADGHAIFGAVQADLRSGLERAPHATGEDERTSAVARPCRRSNRVRRARADAGIERMRANHAAKLHCAYETAAR